MGADGGVSWVALQDPSKYGRVSELLHPFYQLTSSGCADWQEEANEAWLDENSYISPPEYLVGRYGSFQDIDLSHLKEILHPAFMPSCDDTSLTFMELWEDLITRPLTITNGHGEWTYLPSARYNTCTLRYNVYDVNGKRLSPLEILMWDTFKYNLNHMDPIRDMRICDWEAELQSLLDVSSFCYDETWT